MAVFRSLPVPRADLVKVVCRNLELIALVRSHPKDHVPLVEMDYRCHNQAAVHILQQALHEHKNSSLVRRALARRDLLYRNPFADILLFHVLSILENSLSRSSIGAALVARIDLSALRLVRDQTRYTEVEGCRTRP